MVENELKNMYEWYDQADMQAPRFSVYKVSQFNTGYTISVEILGFPMLTRLHFYGTTLYLW